MPTLKMSPPAHSEASSFKFLNLFYFNVFFACVSFSIIMPSIAPYLSALGTSEDSMLLGWVVAVYSVGEMIGSVAFGALYSSNGGSGGGGGWMDAARGPRGTLLSCILLGLVGSAMYVVAEPLKNPWIVFWARAVQGLWTGGQQTIEQSFLSQVIILRGGGGAKTLRIGQTVTLSRLTPPNPDTSSRHRHRPR